MADEAPHQHDHAGHAPHHHHHGDGHGHDHSHDGDTYFLDQLCMVGLAGTVGVICLCLYFWRTGMLQSLLGPQFHLFVLGSGVALLVVALARAAHLWFTADRPTHDHHHAHEHSHAPGETCCDHDHSPTHEQSHAHAHGHHHHHHDHDAGDHSHDWAPWRYVVMLVPIVLFLLGIPTRDMVGRALMFKAQMAGAAPVETGLEHVRRRDPVKDAARYVGLVALAETPLLQTAEVYSVLREEAEAAAKGEPIDFRTLEGIATEPERRAFWQGKMVEVRGQFSSYGSDPRIFTLVRFRISCCAADAIPLRVPMICSEPMSGIGSAEWVKVTGRVEFREVGGGFQTVLIVPRRASVEKCPPDLNPYIQ